MTHKSNLIHRLKYTNNFKFKKIQIKFMAADFCCSKTITITLDLSRESVFHVFIRLTMLLFLIMSLNVCVFIFDQEYSMSQYGMYPRVFLPVCF